MSDLLGGFADVLTVQNLLYAAIGVTIGTLVGVLPGIGPALTIALLLPVALKLDDPTGTLIMFAGIYAGGMYGGSTTSILLNTPGESASVATSIEGYQMALRGRARAALATAAIGSFVAGTLSTILLTFIANPMAKLAVTFRASDYFALAVLAMVAVTALVGSSLIRGLMSLTLGLFLGLIGIDSLTGQARFTFGVPSLLDGVDIVVVIVGLFAIGETLYIASRLRELPSQVAPLSDGGMTREDWKRSWKPWLRGTALGFPFGALPSGGAELPTFLSYLNEKRLSKNKDEWGKGAIEGVAGPEAANNASFSGVLVPLLTLGIPTSATAAVMLAAFNYFDLSPGPQLFEKSSALVWALIASLFIGNIMLLTLNLPMIRIWVKVLQIPRPILYTGILVFATLGVYAVSGNIIDVIIAYAIGVIAMFMRHLEFPIAPVILGVILGPMMETQFRRAMLLSDNDLSIFVTRPLTLTLLLLAVAAIALPHLPKLFKRNRLAFGEDD